MHVNVTKVVISWMWRCESSWVHSDFHCSICCHCRSVPPANLPDGAAHALSRNYYYDRDGRRCNMPEMSVYNATAAKAITAGGDKRCSSSFRWLNTEWCRKHSIGHCTPCGPWQSPIYPLTSPSSALSFSVFYFSLFPFLTRFIYFLAFPFLPILPE